MTKPEITFVRLTEVSINDLLTHMADPRVTEHMPLATAAWDHDACAAFVAAKEACWARDGLGHWGILCGGAYVGWGGFQKEGGEWDFGLVLRPDRFGLGIRITLIALDLARADPRIPYVTFLLSPSRRHLGGLGRLGARYVGKVQHEGRRFLKYRLETPG